MAALLRSTGACTVIYDVADHGVRTPLRRSGGVRVDAAHGLHRLLALHRKGASLVTIAATLNLEGFRTPSDLRWHETSVARAIADAANPEIVEASAS